MCLKGVMHLKREEHCCIISLSVKGWKLGNYVKYFYIFFHYNYCCF